MTSRLLQDDGDRASLFDTSFDWNRLGFSFGGSDGGGGVVISISDEVDEGDWVTHMS